MYFKKNSSEIRNKTFYGTYYYYFYIIYILNMKKNIFLKCFLLYNNYEKSLLKSCEPKLNIKNQLELNYNPFVNI